MTEINRILSLAAGWLITLAPASAAAAPSDNDGILHDLVLRNGAIYDGSGS